MKENVVMESGVLNGRRCWKRWFGYSGVRCRWKPSDREWLVSHSSHAMAGVVLWRETEIGPTAENGTRKAFWMLSEGYAALSGACFDGLAKGLTIRE